MNASGDDVQGPLAVVLQAVDDAVFLCRADGRVTNLNAAAGRVLTALGRSGFSLGGCFDDAWPEMARAAIQRARSATASGQRVQTEVQAPERDGTVRRWNVRWHPVRGETGAVASLCVVVTPGSEAPAAEPIPDVLRRALDAIAEGVVVADLDQRVLYTNRAFNQLAGAESRRELAVGTVAGDAPGQNELRQAIREHVDTGQSFRAEVEGIDATGQRYWHEIAVTPLAGPQGGVTHLVGVREDITKRKQAERVLQESQRRFKSIFEHSIDGILLLDDAGRFQDANPAACRLLGYTRAELLGIDLRQLVLPPGVTDVEALWDEFLRRGSAEGDLSHRRPDFSTVALEYSAIAHILDGLHLCILRDVTDRQALQEQVLRQQRLDSVGRLASGLAHDLNNILTPILMVPGLLRARVQDSGSLNLLDLLEQGARRGAAIIEQLLTFAREMPGERKLQHLPSLVETAARLMRETFPRNLDLDLRIDPAAWPCLGDATQLQQLLLNLAMNSRDAMPDGGRLAVAITNQQVSPEEARATPGARPGPHVVLSVVDTGRGIDPKDLGRIFDPFFTTKPFGEGNGLGLSAALGIARNHGGFITVQSRPGHGATFRVFLPAVGIEAAPATLPGSGASPVADPPGQVVLVVDDEEDLRQVARQWLTQHGYQVICARDGEAALAQLKAADDRVDLVLTDLSMPGMGGDRLVALLRRRNPALRIIVMSGREPEPAAGEPARATGFLRKPFTGEELLRALQSVGSAG